MFRNRLNTGERAAMRTSPQLNPCWKRHSLFFAHLAIEKMLKAHLTRETRDVPPRIHNLVRLAKLAQLNLEPDQLEFLHEFNLYQMEGRYPDDKPVSIDSGLTRKELHNAENILIWLKKQL
jgi:HEPN domain-containing protein